MLKTDNEVRAAKCEIDKPYTDFSCGGNLQLRVYQSKRKTFRSRLKRNGKVKTLDLGGYSPSELTFAVAKRKHELAKSYFAEGYSVDQIRSALKLGGNAVKFDSAIKAASNRKGKYTFAEFARIWWDNKAVNKEWGSDKVAKQNWAYVENHAIPVLGNRSISEITRKDVIFMLTADNKWENKNPLMKKVWRNTRQIFSLSQSTRFELRLDNPADINLSDEAMRVAHYEKPRGFVDYARLPEIYSRLTQIKTSPSQVLIWLMLSAVRPENAAEAEWSEIYGDVWEIPADKMKGNKKTKRRFKCWISPAMRKVLEVMAPQTGSGRYIFVNSRGEKIDNDAPRRMLQRILSKDELVEWRHSDSPDIPTAHGMRHCFKTWASENGYPDEMSEAQSSRSLRGVGKTYDHSVSVEPRITMMTHWDAFLRGAK